MTTLAAPPTLARPQLRDKLDDATAAHPLSLVVAPSGYGKSVLLLDYATYACGVFVDLAGVGSSDFRSAVQAVCDACARLAPGAQLAFASAYARYAERGRLGELGTWLAHHLRGPRVLLAIDGIDSLESGAAAFAEFIETLVSADGAVRVVLAARPETDIPLPRWLAGGLSGVPLGIDELRWSTNEARTFGETVSENCGAAGFAEGRAFDVVFAGLTGRKPPSDAEPGSLLFSALHESERAFVLETCLFPRLTEDVLAAAGLTHGLATLSRLAPLLVRETSTGPAYYAHVVARARTALRSDGVLFGIVAERSVRAMELAGAVREAVVIARHCDLTAELARLLEQYGLQLNDWGHVDTVDAALESLPPDTETPTVLLLRGLHEARRGRFDTSESWFRHAIDRASDTRTKAEAACRLARELVRRQRIDGADLIAPFAANPQITVAQRAAILAVLAETHHVAGRPADARSAIGEAMALAELLDISQRAELYTRAAYVEYFVGDAEAAEAYARIAAASAGTAGLYAVATAAHSVLYNVAYDAGRINDALEHIRDLGRTAVRSGNQDFQLYAIVTELGIQTERGDVAAIERLELALRGFDLEYALATVVQTLLPARALASAWAGNFRAAFEMLAPSAEQGFPDDRGVLRWAEMGLYAAVCGDVAAARRSLARVAHADVTTSYGACALIVGRLAGSMCGDATIARVERPPSGLLIVLRDAVDAVIAARDSAALAELLPRLEQLHAVEMGGYAKLFAALPAR